MDERWDLLDAGKQPVERTHRRGDPVPAGLYHLVVHVWIRNKMGEYLLSRRHPDKPHGLKWECTGGSVLAGETSLAGALREVHEELGLLLDARKAVLRKSCRRMDDFVDAWFFEVETMPESLTFQPEEVVDARWAAAADIRTLEAEGALVPTLSYFSEFI